MRAHGRDTGLFSTTAEDIAYGFAAQARKRYLTSLADRIEDRPGLSAPNVEPGFEKADAIGAQVDGAFLVSFGVEDADGSVSEVEVGDIETGQLCPAHAGSVEDR